MDDKTLLQLLFDRSQEAIPALQARFGTRLFQTAHNILNDRQDAEEVVNDTYLALWDAIPPQRPEPLGGYVHRVGWNLALKKLRFLSAQKRSSKYDLSLEELSQVLPGGSLEEVLDARMLGKAIDSFLDQLSKADRVLFVRRYWFADSVRELAKQRGITENALSVRLSRLRKQLKAYLIREGFWNEP